MLTREYVLENVKYKLVNGKTRHGGTNFPTKDLLNLKAEYRIEIKKGDKTASALISDEIMKYYDLNLTELDNHAKENTLSEKFVFKTLESILKELTNVDWNEETGSFILTNKRNFNGATVLLYDDILNTVANKLDSDLLILPSSIHEVLVLKLERNVNIDFLKNLVTEVNATEVAPEEVLSDTVYLYSRNLNKLMMA